MPEWKKENGKPTIPPPIITLKKAKAPPGTDKCFEFYLGLSDEDISVSSIVDSDKSSIFSFIIILFNY